MSAGREALTNEQQYIESIILNEAAGSATVSIDIGCGNGRYDARLASDPAWTLLAIDISSVALAAAKKRVPSGNFVLCRTNDLGFVRDASADLVFSIATFQHLRGSVVKGYLRDSYRVLKGGGRLIFQVWERSVLLKEGLDDLREGRPRLGAGKLIQGLLLGGNHFEIRSPSWPLGKAWSRKELLRSLGELGFVSVSLRRVPLEEFSALLVSCRKPETRGSVGS